MRTKHICKFIFICNRLDIENNVIGKEYICIYCNKTKYVKV